MKGKPPRFHFELWLSDTALQSASASTRGIWINALCHMWGSGQGILIARWDKMLILLNCTTEELNRFIAENERFDFCDIKVEKDDEKDCKNVQKNATCNDDVTLINRKLYREYRTRKLNSYRVQRHRNAKKTHDVTEMYKKNGVQKVNKKQPENNAKETEEKKVDAEGFAPLFLSGGEEYTVTVDLATEYVTIYPLVDIKHEFRKMRGWLLSNPYRRPKKVGVKRFMNSWLSRAHENQLKNQSGPRNVIPNTQEIDYDDPRVDQVIDNGCD